MPASFALGEGTDTSQIRLHASASQIFITLSKHLQAAIVHKTTRPDGNTVTRPALFGVVALLPQRKSDVTIQSPAVITNEAHSPQHA